MSPPPVWCTLTLVHVAAASLSCHSCIGARLMPPPRQPRCGAGTVCAHPTLHSLRCDPAFRPIPRAPPVAGPAHNRPSAPSNVGTRPSTTNAGCCAAGAMAWSPDERLRKLAGAGATTGDGLLVASVLLRLSTAGSAQQAGHEVERLEKLAGGGNQTGRRLGLMCPHGVEQHTSRGCEALLKGLRRCGGFTCSSRCGSRCSSRCSNGRGGRRSSSAGSSGQLGVQRTASVGGVVVLVRIKVAATAGSVACGRPADAARPGGASVVSSGRRHPTYGGG